MQKRIVKYVHSDYLIQQADKNPAVKGRASLTHSLIADYGLLPHMQLLCPKTCNVADLRGFHNSDYVKQLELCSSHQKSEDEEEDDSDEDEVANEVSEEYGLGFDCPTWAGLKEYTCCIAGATMTACDALCKSESKGAPDWILNWTGGWHHSHREKASGFCYVNDIVLGILVLRKRFQRVLYLDLDVHHGDGVQEAFETTKRVFTLSFHQYECGFYPGSGAAEDCGFAGGKGYSANFPYKSGITGEQFSKYFKRITSQILERYQPDVCVLQCGADAIVGDPLGGSNLTPNDLINCIEFVLKSSDLPAVILGGGGYNFANASRFWTSLSAVLCGVGLLSEDIPGDNDYFLEYGPDYTLHLEPEKFMKNSNTSEYLENCAKIIEENLSKYNVCAV